MSRSFVRFWSNFFAVIGAGLLAYLFTQVPPLQSNGVFDFLAVGLFFIALLLLLFGLSTLAALALHRRWPALAGAQLPNPAAPTLPPGSAALRQGFLASLSLCAVALFVVLGILDSIFVFVIFLIAGLIEVYFQNLGRS